MEQPSILVITGPTASGKSRAAIDLAQVWDAVIVSADAMQVYKGMDIGTAKVTPAEQLLVHHEGLDIVMPDEAFDAAQFQALAHRAIEKYPRVILAGGSPFYIRSAIRGLVETAPPNLELRTELEQLASPHNRLKEVDPDLAEKLHPNDTVRIVRGLEVFYSTGNRLSELHRAHKETPDIARAVGVWLDRENLDEVIDARTAQMVKQGYVQEVKGLLEKGYSSGLKPLQSLGYRHMCAHLIDELPLSTAMEWTQRDTRRFARKQRTWMRGLGFERMAYSDKALLREKAVQAFSC